MEKGMDEISQLTSALRFVPEGKSMAHITEARFSDVSTGACIGHVGPEALADGPLGKLRDGDTIRIVIDRIHLSGSLDVLNIDLDSRTPHPDLKLNPDLPEDTRLWALLQNISGGTWGGCVYDVETIIGKLTAMSL